VGVTWAAVVVRGVWLDGSDLWAWPGRRVMGDDGRSSSYPFFFFAVLGFELRAYTLSHSTSRFCDEFFEIGAHELFPRAGFELRSSRSLTLE
jgi:hypothetical protein